MRRKSSRQAANRRTIPFSGLQCALLATLMLAGCAGEPSIQSGVGAETMMGSLNKVDNSRADLVYVDPDADYGRYTKVFVAPLDLDNVEIVQPNATSSVVNRYNREWELTASDREKLQAAFVEAMQKQLTAGGAFEIAQQGGDDVLQVSGMLTRIAPAGPKDDPMSQTASRSRVYTQGGGSVSIAIAIGDGDSGEVLAIIKDTRGGAQSAPWGVNNSVTNMAEVRRDFSVWAKMLHDGLLTLQARAAM